MQQGLNQDAPQHFQDYKFLEQLAEADHEVYFEKSRRQEYTGLCFYSTAGESLSTASSFFLGVLIRNSLQFITPLVSTLGHIVWLRIKARHVLNADYSEQPTSSVSLWGNAREGKSLSCEGQQ